ncbi:hypothetical protein [Lactobacillus intestinalis]|nr:hypothetical protein [Lactobacillus intestinalis]
MDSIINMQAYPTQAPAEYFVKKRKKHRASRTRVTIICWNVF